MAIKIGGTLGQLAGKAKSNIVQPIGGTLGQLAGKAKSNIVQPIAKTTGDAWSVAVKRPIQATYQSVKTGNAQPFKEYVGDVWGTNIKAPLNKAGGKVSGAWKENIWNPIKDAMGGGSGGGGGAAPDYSKYTLGLAKEAGAPENASLTSLISGNESADGIKANIAQQYGSLGSLAKLREGTQRQSEQSAISRRLASSGMGASGAGMRMQQQADQQSGRRAAETQLALGSEQAGAEARAQDAAAGRNIQREGMRVGATESEANRAFRDREFNYRQEADAKSFAREGEVIAENQKIAREIQRYNESGLLGQLGQDLFGSAGKKTSMRTPFGGLGL